jgi:hypothetical protein
MYLFGSLMYVIRTELVSLGHPVQGAATHTQEYAGVTPVALASGALLQGCAQTMTQSTPVAQATLESRPCRRIHQSHEHVQMLDILARQARPCS